MCFDGSKVHLAVSVEEKCLWKKTAEGLWEKAAHHSFLCKFRVSACLSLFVYCSVYVLYWPCPVLQ